MSKRDSILILSGVRGDTRRYRTFHPFEQLKLAGANCAFSHTTDPMLPAKVSQAAVVIFHRTAYDPYIKQLLQSVKEQGGLTICDIDDLVFDTSAFRWIDSPDFQDPVRAALYQEDMRKYRATLEACQAVTTATRFLADRARAMDKPAWVHRNAFSLEMLAISESAFQQRRREASKVVIGYASGTPTHDRDFQVAKTALQHVLLNYPETELWLVGPLDPGGGWEQFGERIKRHKFRPWRELPSLLAQFDINLAPLVMDNPFGQSKSEIKYVEAGLVRAPTIASPTGAFGYAIQSGENGLLAPDPEAWANCLSQLIEQKDLRRAMAERAYQDVIDRYHPLQRAREWITTLDEIHQHCFNEPLWGADIVTQLHASLGKGGAQRKPKWLATEWEKTPTFAQMALYSLRYRGVRTLLKQAWIFVRRLLAPIFPYRRPAE